MLSRGGIVSLQPWWRRKYRKWAWISVAGILFIGALIASSFLSHWPSSLGRRALLYATEQTASLTSAEETAEEKILEWSKPRFEERREERERMVQAQIAARGIEDEAVLAAMRSVPRQLFVPSEQSQRAYADSPLPIGHGQTISQPFIVAYMTEWLEIEPGDRILEIGTGSGYQAAVLSELTPYVYTIEIIENLGEQAIERFESLGYETIQAKIADGYFGWSEVAPFDGIIVTCAAGHIPPPLLDQMNPGGRMIIPVGGVYDVQYLVLVTKDDQGEIYSETLLPVRFVPMTGWAQRNR
jgi:protein-L-isoaspartate(D-aspartate) O-methyltransferase